MTELLHGHVGERCFRQRALLATGIDNAQPAIGPRVLRQHPHQSARRDISCSQDRRQRRDAKAGARGPAQYLLCVAVETPSHAHHLLHAIHVLQVPRDAATGIGLHHAVMLSEFFQVGGHAMRRQVGRAGDQIAMAREDLTLTQKTRPSKSRNSGMIFTVEMGDMS